MSQQLGLQVTFPIDVPNNGAAPEQFVGRPFRADVAGQRRDVGVIESAVPHPNDPTLVQLVVMVTDQEVAQMVLDRLNGVR